MGTSLSAKALKEMLPKVEKLYDYLEVLDAPEYPELVDPARAERGRQVFESSCTRCHGEKTADGKYKYTQVFVPLSKVQTDSARSDADLVNSNLMKVYNRSWLTDYGTSAVATQPGHYIAPALHGVWATAPYLHNGSVPTLRAMFFHDERPLMWKRTTEYDMKNPGIRYTALTQAEYDRLSWRDQKRVYNTQLYSQSNKGHPFGSNLSTEEKLDLLEYLKTFLRWVLYAQTLD